MGLGVVDPLDGSPLVKWQLTLQAASAQSGRLADAARDLLSGHPADTDDDAVQSFWLPGGPRHGRIHLRDADVSVRYALDVDLRALDGTEVRRLGPKVASGGVATVVPGAWIVAQWTTGRRWELFNCRVRLVKIVRA